MATSGGTGPPDSPIISELNPHEESFDSQYSTNMVADQVNAAAAAASSETVQPAAGSSPDQAVDLEDKMIKMVSIT
eukprot:6860337-Karenia_brevis.AAC.1